jgi:hypothetical protein
MIESGIDFPGQNGGYYLTEHVVFATLSFESKAMVSLCQFSLLP